MNDSLRNSYIRSLERKEKRALNEFIHQLDELTLYLQAKAGFNPDQPRVPAGDPDGGQWTDGGGGSASIDANNHISNNLTDVHVDKFPTNVDQHGKPLDYQPVKYPNGKHIVDPNTNRPYPKQFGMDIAKDVEKGRSATKLDMVRWFRHYGTMDYQRTIGNPDLRYRNVTNYVFGAVSAARGDTLDAALHHAGTFNKNLGRMHGGETPYGILPDAVNNITHGWNDYHKGIFTGKE